MMRKTISFLALTLLLSAGLAFAGSEPVSAPAPSEQPAQLDLQALLDGNSCAPQPVSVKPGCSKTCKVDRDCPAYPEQVCLSGCCVY